MSGAQHRSGFYRAACDCDWWFKGGVRSDVEDAADRHEEKHHDGEDTTAVAEFGGL